MKKDYKDMTVGEGLITALKQAIEYEQNRNVAGVTSRKIAVAPVPHYEAPKIKEIRLKLGISQSTFANVIGVSKRTVEAWESGRNEPQGPAQRILMFMEKDNHFLEKFNLIRTL